MPTTNELFSRIPSAPSAQRAAIRKHFVAACGELVGTFMFLFFAFCGQTMVLQQATDQGPDNSVSSSTVVYISLCYASSLLITVWSFYRISGGLFNPAVTLAMVVTGSLPPIRGLVLLPAQMLGGICAAAVVAGIIPGPISVVQTTLNPSMSVAQGVFLEMFLTAELIFSILMLAAEKSRTTFMAPVGIGIALFVAELAGVFYTGGSLNPARSFGPAVAAASFPEHHWIYWVGPGLGALLSAAFYGFVKILHYEDVNPGQDSCGESEAPVEGNISIP